MNDVDRRGSGLNTADVIAIGLALISLGIMLVAADQGSPILMWIASGVAFPSAVLKVISSRAKSR